MNPICVCEPLLNLTMTPAPNEPVEWPVKISTFCSKFFVALIPSYLKYFAGINFRISEALN